jgi:hypothetical protein
MMLRSDSQTLALASAVRAHSALTRRRARANQVISVAAYRARWLMFARSIGVTLALVLSFTLVWQFRIRPISLRAVPENRAALLYRHKCAEGFNRFSFTPQIKTRNTLGYLTGYYPGQLYRDSLIQLLEDNQSLLPNDAQKWAREKPKKKVSPERLPYLEKLISEWKLDQELTAAIEKLRSGIGEVNMLWLTKRLIEQAETDKKINLTLKDLELDLINVDQRPLCIPVNKREVVKGNAN